MPRADNKNIAAAMMRHIRTSRPPMTSIALSSRKHKKAAAPETRLSRAVIITPSDGKNASDKSAA